MTNDTKTFGCGLNYTDVELFSEAKMTNLIKNLLADKSGVSAIEYAVIGGVVITAVVAGLATFDVAGVFTDLAGALPE